MKKVVVFGAGGFIGSHLVRKLKNEGHWVCGVDLKFPEYENTPADLFIQQDLRNILTARLALRGSVDELYQLAADMGGAGYIFTGDHDLHIVHNSAQVNLNTVEVIKNVGVGKVFFSSSACVYPAFNQEDPNNPKCSEDSAYPAYPDSEYGWEKLFSERLYETAHRNENINIRIARFHNIFGPKGTWSGGKEKAPAALCRKVAAAPDGGSIEVWGDGKQTRSFLYIDECLEGISRLMNSRTFYGPVNIGSEEMITINDLALKIIHISGKKLGLQHIDGPFIGVRGRNSDNKLIREKLGWAPSQSLQEGLEKTYKWVKEQNDKINSI